MWQHNKESDIPSTIIHGAINFFDATIICDEIDANRPPPKNMHIPPEIFTIVSDYISLHDISSLALTCSEVNRWIGMNDVIREYYLVECRKRAHPFSSACKYGYINLLMYLHHTGNVMLNKAIILASRHGHLPIVKYLHSVGADPTTKDNDPIRWACVNGHLSVVEYLHSIGADPTYESIKRASSGGHLDVVKYLCSVGVDPTADNNAPIKIAVHNGHLDVVKYLHSVGANPTTVDNGPIKWASANGHNTVVEYLRSI